MFRAAVVGIAASLLAATTAAAAPTPKQLELAHRYILAIHMDRTFKATMDAMTR